MQSPSCRFRAQQVDVDGAPGDGVGPWLCRPKKKGELMFVSLSRANNISIMLTQFKMSDEDMCRAIAQGAPPGHDTNTARQRQVCAARAIAYTQPCRS